MQSIKFYQSLWAMELRRPGKKEASLQQQFAKIAEANYSGICLDPSVDEINDYAQVKDLCREYRLDCMLNAFPYQLDDMCTLLDFAAELDAKLVNIIGGIMPVEVDDAVPIIKQWMSQAEEYSFPVLFETHRDSLLNDLYFTLQVLDRVPEIRLCADLSHFVVDRETRLPLSAQDSEYYTRILDHSDCFQGRVASREQIQIQIAFSQHQDWVNQFKQWWQQGISGWRQRNSKDAELIFLCELGPPPYAITDANQEELSDRFEEALTIRSWVEEIWSELANADNCVL